MIDTCHTESICSILWSCMHCPRAYRGWHTSWMFLNPWRFIIAEHRKVVECWQSWASCNACGATAAHGMQC